jgi:hypothetical protein
MVALTSVPAPGALITAGNAAQAIGTSALFALTGARLRAALSAAQSVRSSK